MATLNLFPARLPIGVVQEDGSVLMTPEFFRALTDVLQRVGGQNGVDNSDLELMANTAQQPVDMSSFFDAVAVQQIAESSNAQLQKRIEDLEAQSGYTDQFRVNWERPGSIGLLTPNSGAFTTLTASGAVTLSPANANVVISPTGTGVVTVAPATAGTINNMSIGATTPLIGKFTSLTATLGFGCNGAAAQTAAASGGAVVTTASTNVSPFGYTTAAQADRIVALLNSIRAALVANGIMS